MKIDFHTHIFPDALWEDRFDHRIFLKKCGFTEGEIGKMDSTAKRLLRI